MMSRMEMICSRCDWLIPVWMMSMSKRPSSPATLPIQYSTIRTARSASSTVTASLSRIRAPASARRMIASSCRGVIGTLEPAASPVFRMSRYFFSMTDMASVVMIG